MSTDPEPRFLNKTREEWHRELAQEQANLTRLMESKRSALLVGAGEEVKALEKQINIAEGTILACRQALANPPFYEKMDGVNN